MPCTAILRMRLRLLVVTGLTAAIIIIPHIITTCLFRILAPESASPLTLSTKVQSSTKHLTIFEISCCLNISNRIQKAARFPIIGIIHSSNCEPDRILSACPSILRPLSSTSFSCDYRTSETYILLLKDFLTFWTLFKEIQ